MTRTADIGWKYGSPVQNDKSKVQCSFCKHTFDGGINRFKKHLVGGYNRDATSCDKVPAHVKGEIIEFLGKKILLGDDVCIASGVKEPLYRTRRLTRNMNTSKSSERASCSSTLQDEEDVSFKSVSVMHMFFIPSVAFNSALPFLIFSTFFSSYFFPLFYFSSCLHHTNK
ncbi:hypothetical protein POM88_034236 [Heracleum sosnowskyi]|uniref:BED-type domain-containing protein n=1 Tax=Heracleum sosnowskyi TaxID=360622 RepID=A0AAD8HKV0_9APIA|nr:hypothetical protein POM88_034236 [Heracleum sosnowskyi]